MNAKQDKKGYGKKSNIEVGIQPVAHDGYQSVLHYVGTGVRSWLDAPVDFHSALSWDTLDESVQYAVYLVGKFSDWYSSGSGNRVEKPTWRKDAEIRGHREVPQLS